METEKLREYVGKHPLYLGQAHVAFDNDRGRIVLRRCVRPRKFFAILPINLVECSFAQVWRIKRSTVESVRWCDVTLPEGNFTFSSEAWPDFDELVDEFSRLEDPAACPTELKHDNERTIQILLTIAVIIIFGLVVFGGLRGWF